MIYLKAFIAGFVSTLVFHQSVLWLLYAGGFFAASALEHDAGPPTSCTSSNFPRILGWRVGHRVVVSDRCFRWQRLLDKGTRDRCTGSESGCVGL